MTEWRLTKTRMTGGVWEGVLSGPEDATPPALEATWLERPLESPEVSVLKGGPGWQVRLRIPAEVLTDGVHTVLIGASGGDPLAVETFVCGDPLEDDLRAEISLLRAELDMLKKAFRRHCLETM